MQIYYFYRYISGIYRQFTAAFVQGRKKEQHLSYSLFLKDGIEKIIIKDKQHLSFEYIIALILQKCKYIIPIAIYMPYTVQITQNRHFCDEKPAFLVSSVGSAVKNIYELNSAVHIV